LGLEATAEVVGPCAHACDVVADRDGERRLLIEREAVVEAGDTEGVSRRYIQAPAGIFEAAATYPADLVLKAVEYREQKIALRSRCAAAAREMVVRRRPLTTLPERLGRSEDRIDGRDLSGGRRSPGRADVH
jgi:hypothetical protein